MSIRFPTDNDAGMSRQNAPRRPGGGGKFFFMLIIGVVAFMVMRGTSSQPRTPTESNPDRGGEIGSTKYPDLQSGEQLELLDDQFSDSEQRTDRGDWGLEDGPVQKNAAAKKPSTKSSNGDWGMEDVTTKSSAQQPAGRFSQSSDAPVKELQKKQPTSQGDWSLDTDVESTPELSKPKKTVEGDWGLEEVE